MQSIREYQELISEVDQLCHDIRQSYRRHIACQKGCAGNCCQRHINVFPIEAASLVLGLRKLPQVQADKIRHKARQTTSFGPCPLLEEGACRMYESRAIICRTHGYPISSEYRGRRTVGFCHRNFKHLPAIADDRMIHLTPLNKRLAAINRRFISEFDTRRRLMDRFTIAEALDLDIHYFDT